MKVEVIMPQMGESIAEGTINRWIKNLGDSVEPDEPILEISTDKVDAEIPSPAGGKLIEIRHQVGETVPINTIIALIETDMDQVTEVAEDQPSPMPMPMPMPMPSPMPMPMPSPIGGRGRELEQAATSGTVQSGPLSGEDRERPHSAQNLLPPLQPRRLDQLRRVRSSPLVRRMAAEHNIDLRLIEGTGISGRVTKRDILRFLPAAPGDAAAEKISGFEPHIIGPQVPASAPGERVNVVPMTVIRRTIAQHMIRSQQTSAHVTTVFEIDMTRVMRIRDRLKEEFKQRQAVKLTPLAFIMQACIRALKAFPIFNASVSGDNILYKQDINLGIAVALDWGLIVPVVKRADEKSLLGLAKAVQSLAAAARQKKLAPEDVQAGTFTITNPGGFGSLFGTPIINQPQVAILGLGAITKRPVVIDGDAIAIRSMAYFALTFDHRIADGAMADQFMAHIKQTLENFDPGESNR